MVSRNLDIADVHDDELRKTVAYKCSFAAVLLQDINTSVSATAQSLARLTSLAREIPYPSAF